MVLSYQRVSFFLILAILCLPHSGHSHKYLRTIPEKTYSEVQGVKLYLPCTSDQKDVTCYWLRNNNIIEPDEDFIYDRKTSQGNCSMTIRSLSFPRDNTTFECQVPFSIKGGSSKDYPWPTTSVIVMIKPNAPRFKSENLNDIPAEQGQTLVCESQKGNPLPVLEWYLNGKNITANASTTANGESVTSTLSYTFKKENNGARLTCVSVHQKADWKQTTEKVLNVSYRPSVSVEKRSYIVHEGESFEIDCKVDANPLALAIWNPIDQTLKQGLDYKLNGSRLKFSNISGSMDGKGFQCSSVNTNGASETVTVAISVLYQPKPTKMAGNEHQTVKLGDDLNLTCNYRGNPKPSIRFRFVDSINHQERYLNLVESELIIKNVSYLNEGDYYCQGQNAVDGNVITVESTKIAVDVTGKPQFLNGNEPIVGYQNTNTIIEADFCSDPPPKHIEWVYDGITQHKIDVDFRKKKQESNSFEIQDGSHIKARSLMPLDKSSPNPTCFATALHIGNTDIADAKDFTIIVENEKGRVEKIISLEVYKKISSAMIISISIIVLFLLVILTILVIFLLRRRSSDQSGQDCENKSDSRVPIHNTDDTAKEASIEKNDAQMQIYANIDFIGIDHSKRQPTAIFTREPTEYANISFDS